METPGHTPKHNDLIYDVGMHKGEDAEFYLRKGFRVVAFEANPELIASCKQRLRDFLDHGQLTIVEGAIVEPDLIAGGQKTVQFYGGKDPALYEIVVNAVSAKNTVTGYLSVPKNAPVPPTVN